MLTCNRPLGLTVAHNPDDCPFLGSFRVWVIHYLEGKSDTRYTRNTMIPEFPPGRSLQLLKGDITRIPVDAIVNAANERLMAGTGVDVAIHAAGGPAISLELATIRTEK